MQCLLRRARKVAALQRSKSVSQEVIHNVGLEHDYNVFLEKSVGDQLEDLLTVQHTTIYRYRRPVTFGAHRLMLRPRDGHDLRLLATKLDISPAGTSKWVYDVLGNSVTIVSFTEPASELRFASKLTIERYGSRPPRGEVEASAAHLSLHLFDAGSLRSREDARAALHGPDGSCRRLGARLCSRCQHRYAGSARRPERQLPAVQLSEPGGRGHPDAAADAAAALGLMP